MTISALVCDFENQALIVLGFNDMSTTCKTVIKSTAKTIRYLSF